MNFKQLQLIFEIEIDIYCLLLPFLKFQDYDL
jgi:hypothetical protein